MTAARRTPAARKPAAAPEQVKSLLRELAYVMHVTRKVNRQIAWPAAAPRGRTTDTASPVASV